MSMAVIAYAMSTAAVSQVLQPGFDAEEYRECLRITSHMHIDEGKIDSIYMSAEPRHSTRLYYSPTTGFDNEWELWRDDTRKVVHIVLRATVTTMKSWGSNFNAGLVPAHGVTEVGKRREYCLSNDSSAMVHGGWVAGLMTMVEDIDEKLDSCLKAGCRDFIICGHSQGGGLSYLTTARLRIKQQEGKIPSDVRFKTYCSAAPKPGDYAFALSYEHLTQGGWSYTVVNADDWVPELPLSVQRPTDMRPTNPFANIDELLKSSGPMTRLKLKFLYNRLYKPTDKAVRNIEKYLGTTVGEMMEGQVPEYKQPAEYSDCANYARTGPFIILMPDEGYHQIHPHVAKDAFEHHMYKAYEYLADKL